MFLAQANDLNNVTTKTGRDEIVEEKAGYEDIRSKLQDAATPDRFRELHLSLIKFGQEICTARNPKHHQCLLYNICPFPEKGILFDKQGNVE